MPNEVLTLIIAAVGVLVPWFLKSTEEKNKIEQKKREDQMADLGARIKVLEEKDAQRDVETAEIRKDHQHLSEGMAKVEKILDKIDEKIERALRRTIP